jgi:glycolate oxidase FAD binding subunit
MGLVHVELRPVTANGGEASRLLETLELLEGTARRAGGQLLIETLPTREKRERDVFGEAGPAIEIMKKLKREFDPHGVLNPGRFAGGI